ncbi:MAG: signal recognition particle-docking protein FtsY [Clostridiales bacterium]|nr:signal recognition particle-docking protein FtsY [Clostridiales bacterium]
MGVFSKFFGALKKTKDAISKKISQIFVGELDDDFYEDLEYMLVSSDISVEAAAEIVDNVKALAKKQKVKTEEDFKKILREAMAELLDIEQDPEEFPTLYTIIGVNGVGKTTAIGKLAHNYKKQKKSVLMVAGDTFRASASDQLVEWSKRAGVRIVKYGEGVDPGAVVFDGVKSAVARKDDVVLVDTAGRLHNKVGLMDELKKIAKIIGREWNGATKNYLVIDATTGQNAMVQVEMFNEIMPLDGIILTKLDGSSKGGVVFAIVKKFGIPIKWVGVGEGIDDLEPFDPKAFVENII